MALLAALEALSATATARGACSSSSALSARGSSSSRGLAWTVLGPVSLPGTFVAGARRPRASTASASKGASSSCALPHALHCPPTAAAVLVVFVASLVLPLEHPAAHRGIFLWTAVEASPLCGPFLGDRLETRLKPAFAALPPTSRVPVSVPIRIGKGRGGGGATSIGGGEAGKPGAVLVDALGAFVEAKAVFVALGAHGCQLIQEGNVVVACFNLFPRGGLSLSWSCWTREDGSGTRWRWPGVAVAVAVAVG